VWAGNPAAFVRELSKAEVEHAEEEASAVADAAAEHADEFLPFTTAYQSAEALGVEDADVGLSRVKTAHAERAKEEEGGARARGGVGSGGGAASPYGVPWRG
jgi:hypothetical protein